MKTEFKELTKEDELQVSGGGLFGIFLIGTIGAEVGMIVALVYNTVTGARGDKAGENTAALMKTGAIVGGCIGAFTVV